MIDQAIYRRFNHTAAACFVLYFLFPEKILGLDRIYLVFTFWFGVLLIEYFRLNKVFVLDGMRDYESSRIAGFVWFATGTCFILIFYEIGVFPEIFAISTIIMASYADPVIGEINSRYGEKLSLIGGLVTSFVIYQLLIGVLFYSLIGSIVAVIIEKPKFRWLDDDLLLQIFPITAMTLCYLSGFGPDITDVGGIR
tara:strand:- start:570 stop:1157 length:588 start_codon:yes stop_codon:yes gene_type:complete